MAHYSPLRYPGGKGKLAPFLTQIIKHNDLIGGTYIEPYAGGAGVALALLLQGHIGKVIINDYDPNIYAFWWAILHDTDSFCRMIVDTPVTLEQWEIQKKIFHSSNEALLQKGFATFFLNRTNRSGILLGGIIGGREQSGKDKIDARFNKKTLIKRIEVIAKHADNITVFNEDALKLLQTIRHSFSQKTFIYFDPPYFKKGKLLYQNSYKEEDHAKLAAFIRTLSTPWLVTYDYTPEIEKLYAGEQQAAFNIAYTAYTKRRTGQELMFYKHIDVPSLPYTSKLQAQTCKGL